MKDRDDKKSFIIPKTSTSNKDILIPEKINGRNVTELFDDIKSCALDTYFDFAQDQCQSCDSIRNPKLQKLYNEKRNEMKKDRDPIERFAFHLVSTRDQALDIANEGLTCEQLSFSMDKYLGNPKDGIHLCRRPDVVLLLANKKKLRKFGLLICKILMGKGYPTVPSPMNDKFAAQLHYDHHFCKIQSTTSEQVNLDGLLTKSLIFCYEHQDFQTVTRPSQILPIALLWYELKETFLFHSSLLPRLTQQSEKRSYQQKMINIQNVPKKLMNISMVDFHGSINKVVIAKEIPSEIYSSSSTTDNQTNSNLIGNQHNNEIITISPKKLRQSSQSTPIINIPLESTGLLTDPRQDTSLQKQFICYLEAKAVRYAAQQQRLFNVYHQSVNSSTVKTSYTLIPLIHRHESQADSLSTSLTTECPTVSVSVVDCFDFGFRTSIDENYIDLGDSQNQWIYEQIEISNQLTAQKKQLATQDMRLRLNEKRQRQLRERWKNQSKILTSSATSKVHIENGRMLLKNHELPTSFNNQMSDELINFFAFKYRRENRAHVKRLLAELMGVFMENDSYQSQTIVTAENQKNLVDKQTTQVQQMSPIENRNVTSTIDMDIESPMSQSLGDHDERFPFDPLTDLMRSTANQSNSNPDHEACKPEAQMESTSRNSFLVLNEQSRSSSTDTVPIHDAQNLPAQQLEPLAARQSLTATRQNLVAETPSMSSSQDSDERRASLNQLELKNCSVKRARIDTTRSLNSHSTITHNSTNPINQRTLGCSPSQVSATTIKPMSIRSSNSYSNTHRHRRPSLNEQHRSYIRSYSQRSRFNNYSNFSSQTHERPEYFPRSTTDRPVFASNNTLSSSSIRSYKRFDPHQYPKLMEERLPTLMGNRNNPSSYYEESANSYPFFQDHPPPIPPLMSTLPSGNFSSSYNFKPSDTIERLQMFLQNRP